MIYLSHRFWIGSFLLLLTVFASRALAQAGPPFRTDDPETPGNKHWEINFGWIGDRNPAAGAYRVGEFATGQSKQRQTTLGLGGRQALNKEKNLILLLMGGTSFQTVSVNNSQPTWIAYVGLQVLLGPK